MNFKEPIMVCAGDTLTISSYGVEIYSGEHRGPTQTLHNRDEVFAYINAHNQKV